MQPQSPNPYGFIMDNTQKKRNFSFGGGSQKDRLLQVVIAAILLLIIVIVVVAVLGNVGKDSSLNLYKVAAAQQDLISLTALGATNARNTQLINSSATAGAVITSQNNQVISIIATNGDKKPTKAIAVYQDKTYEKLLEDAKISGKYDETYAALFANRLDDYRIKLQSTFASTKSVTAKKQLSDAYIQLNLLTPTSPNAN